ncbi:substrate-binding domain-containing protein [Calothrix sp. 336/3]|uniref:substrate-binding domain-containing protein n=1 Tax=Calothrix sp. 336/3 TaxID=1337936 RepID=UPI0004E3AE4D|nr:substrate-binding domain-containing protein [Calothrix sp. 336/3]AKG23461.1 phosphate ABC transporter substrate-binding protein [Calothrix sp. 336/3]
MTHKNEIPVLFLALFLTLGLIGGVFYWLANNSLVSSPNLFSSQKVNKLNSGFLEVKNVPSGLFRYGGSTTWAPIRRDVDSQIKTMLPKFGIVYTDPISEPPGSGSGIKMLLSNQLAFSQSSRSLKTEEYQEAKTKGFTLKEIPVAIDGIAIAVHPSLKIPGLAIAQIRDIYTGKITNWQQVGGENLPIVPYSRQQAAGGTVEFFAKEVLGDNKFAANVKYVHDTTQALREVAQNRAGIYYASAPEIVGQCSVKPLPIGKTTEELVTPYKKPFIPLSQCPQKRNQIDSNVFQTGEYPIVRRLFVIIKQNGQADEVAGEAYANLLLTENGQELIDKTGFVRIR